MSAKEQGLSLLDIGPLSETVPLVDGKAVKVYGVSVKGCFSIIRRFPEVGSWFKGGTVDLPMLVQQAPDAIAAVLAAGCGTPDDSEAELVASLLPMEAQLDILEAIGRLTFRSGFGPFVQRIVALSDQAKSLNYGRASATTLPQGSKNASQPDTVANPSGT